MSEWERVAAQFENRWIESWARMLNLCKRTEDPSDTFTYLKPTLKRLCNQWYNRGFADGRDCRPDPSSKAQGGPDTRPGPQSVHLDDNLKDEA